MARLAKIALDGETVENVFEGSKKDFPDAVDVTGTRVSKNWSYDEDSGTFSERMFARLDAEGRVLGVSRGTPSTCPGAVEVVRGVGEGVIDGKGTYRSPRIYRKLALREFISLVSGAGVKKKEIMAAQKSEVPEVAFVVHGLNLGLAYSYDDPDMKECMDALVAEGHLSGEQALHIEQSWPGNPGKTIENALISREN